MNIAMYVQEVLPILFIFAETKINKTYSKFEGKLYSYIDTCRNSVHRKQDFFSYFLLIVKI